MIPENVDVCMDQEGSHPRLILLKDLYKEKKKNSEIIQREINLIFLCQQKVNYIAGYT